MVNLIGVATHYGCRPSLLLAVDDPYTAFCLDEACAYIATRIKNGDEPKFKRKYKSFKDMYRNIV